MEKYIFDQKNRLWYERNGGCHIPCTKLLRTDATVIVRILGFYYPACTKPLRTDCNLLDQAGGGVLRLAPSPYARIATANIYKKHGGYMDYICTVFTLSSVSAATQRLTYAYFLDFRTPSRPASGANLPFTDRSLMVRAEVLSQ